MTAQGKISTLSELKSPKSNHQEKKRGRKNPGGGEEKRWGGEGKGERKRGRKRRRKAFFLGKKGERNFDLRWKEGWKRVGCQWKSRGVGKES